MKNSLTPEAIVSDFLNGKLHLNLAVELLLSLLEKSDNSEMRRKSIIALEKLGVNDYKIFKILENILLSDENPYVRSAAAKLIGQSYLKYGKKTLLWVIQHEKSPAVIKTMVNMIEKEPPHFRTIAEEIFNWLKNFSLYLGVIPNESKFFLDLEVFFSQNNIGYEISSHTYQFYEKISHIKNDQPWLIIKNKHIEILNFNYLNWYFLKINQDMIDSFIKMIDLDTFLNLYEKIELRRFNGIRILKSLKYLKNLKKLVLRGNSIDTIPEFLTDIENLEELDLSYNSIREIPNSIMNLKNLKILKLNNNNLKQTTFELKSFLSSLEIVDI
ncbi:MAG: leucine-rich repeat domain-containing protein [Candidatus Thorarchaeota archaeon]